MPAREVPIGGEPDASRSTPRYLRVAHDLGREIATGAYESGGKLPTEGELAKRYRVSRGTVRHALSVLRTNGLVTSRRGTPRVVLRTAQGQSFGELLSFTRWARSIGKQPGGRIVRLEWGEASDEECDQLRLTADAQVCRVLRIRTLSRRPVMVERTAYPQTVGELIAALARDVASYTVELESRGVLFADAQHTIDVVPADADDAELLECRVGESLMRERRRSTDPAGVPIEWADDRYLPGSVAFTVHSSASAGSLARRPAVD